MYFKIDKPMAVVSLKAISDLNKVLGFSQLLGLNIEDLLYELISTVNYLTVILRWHARIVQEILLSCVLNILLLEG